MTESNKIILAFFAGAATVAAIGLLASSEKGDEIRRDIINAAKYLSDKILNKETIKETKGREQEFRT